MCFLNLQFLPSSWCSSLIFTFLGISSESFPFLLSLPVIAFFQFWRFLYTYLHLSCLTVLLQVYSFWNVLLIFVFFASSSTCQSFFSPHAQMPQQLSLPSWLHLFELPAPQFSWSFSSASQCLYSGVLPFFPTLALLFPISFPGFPSTVCEYNCKYTFRYFCFFAGIREQIKTAATQQWGVERCSQHQHKGLLELVALHHLSTSSHMLRCLYTSFVLVFTVVSTRPKP